jgi:excisionase family DNA binding protein
MYSQDVVLSPVLLPVLNADLYQTLNEQLLTVEEAAKALNMTESTIRTYLQRGTLAPVRIRGRVFFSQHEILRYQQRRSGRSA